MLKVKFADVLIITVVLLTICSASILAQTSSVAVTPASIDTKVRAGSSYTQKFTLTNNTNQELRFRCSSADIWFDDDNRRVTAKAGTQPRSASLWMQFTPSEVVVGPHSSGMVTATITIPQTASGSFYTVPVFEAAPAIKPVIQSAAFASTATANIGLRFRTLMMLTTERGAEYNVEIMAAKASPPDASSELELKLDLRNRGNAHARVRGAFAIIDSFGKLAGRGGIDEKRFLPGQRAPLNSKWSGELKPGEYTAIVTLSYSRIGMDPTSLVQEIPFTVK